MIAIFARVGLADDPPIATSLRQAGDGISAQRLMHGAGRRRSPTIVALFQRTNNTQIFLFGSQRHWSDGGDWRPWA
jgi:hypothetical protein